MVFLAKQNVNYYRVELSLHFRKYQFCKKRLCTAFYHLRNERSKGQMLFHALFILKKKHDRSSSKKDKNVKSILTFFGERQIHMICLYISDSLFDNN